MGTTTNTIGNTTTNKATHCRSNTTAKDTTTNGMESTKDASTNNATKDTTTNYLFTRDNNLFERVNFDDLFTRTRDYDLFTWRTNRCSMSNTKMWQCMR